MTNRENHEYEEQKSVLLSEGDQGEKVKALQSYLKRFGFLGSGVFEEFGFQISLPEQTSFEDGIFDKSTKKALELFQETYGLQITGELNEETKNLIDKPRCGVPDIPRFDSVRFDPSGGKWNKLDLSYAFQEFTPDLPVNDIRTAIRDAFNLWSSVTLLRFREVPLGSGADIIIRFVAGDHGDGKPFDGTGGDRNVLAHAFYPPPLGEPFSGDAHFDEAENWTVNLISGTDLMTVAAHEFGHSLGLGHSTISSALMYPMMLGPHRYLDIDDIKGIQFLYDPKAGRNWEGLPGAAFDIGVGANGAVWTIGTDNSIFRWTGTSWQGVDGSAFRIAVDPSGNPWVVNSRAEIFRRIGGAWQGLPGAAWDIGVGANGVVWVIGTQSAGAGFGIFRWNGSGWDGIDGAAVRIAVAPDGNPWVVNSNREIFRRVGNSWEGLPGSAIDIGVGADGSVWVVGTGSTGAGYGIWKWTGSRWYNVEGAAIGISVGPTGLPWVINSRQEIFRRV